MGRLFRQFLRRSFVCSVVLLAGSAGCRSHEPLCIASGCDPSGAAAGSDGGAPASTDSPESQLSGRGGGRGDAGGATEPGTAACRRDADCDDQHACNGQELCVDAACQATAVPICTDGTACVEDVVGPDCRYSTSSPWLIIQGRTAIRGLPLAQIGQRELFLLGEQEVAEGVTTGFGDSHFSPDGRRVWIPFFSEDVWESTLFEVLLGPGLPGQLERVPDLPELGSFSDPVFSADGRRGYVEDENSGLYLFDFESENPERYQGRLLGELEYAWYNSPRFCHDSRLLVVSGEAPSAEDWDAPFTPAWLFALGSNGEVSQTELGTGVATVVGQGRLIVLQGPGGVEVLGCQRELPRVQLAEGTWDEVTSKDGGLYIELRKEEEHVIFSMADPQSPVLVFACDGCSPSWAGDQEHIEAVVSDESVWLELRGNDSPVPGLPESLKLLGEELAGRVEATGEKAFLVKGFEYELEANAGAAGAAGQPDNSTTSEFGLVFRENPTVVEPITRTGHHVEGWLEWSDVDAGLAIVRRQTEGPELWLLRFAERPFTEVLIAAGQGTSELAVSPDHSGFAYSFAEPRELKRNKTMWQPFAQNSAPIELAVPGRPTFGPRLP